LASLTKLRRRATQCFFKFGCWKRPPENSLFTPFPVAWPLFLSPTCIWQVLVLENTNIWSKSSCELKTLLTHIRSDIPLPLSVPFVILFHTPVFAVVSTFWCNRWNDNPMHLMLDVQSLSSVGVGTYRMSSSQPVHFQALKTAVEHGYNLIDTATNYCAGTAEELIGDFIQAHPQ